ncbi:hypothetical protein [Cerasicoccus frondis]|uniref:hypothetical protein n=1 Tax=Cerasicoccus frondis TaxID=490090 RepID=UPI002852D82B|nr:hypothetical protein [Cerasicoccus frondis]
MTSRFIFGGLALISGFVGLVCGVAEWVLQIMILPEVDWAEPFATLTNMCWFGHIFFYGVGLCFAGLGLMSAIKPAPAQTSTTQPPASTTEQQTPAPPPLPPKATSNSKDQVDLWQAESAPFPKPDKIEHPEDEESLWQAESMPFPKVEIPPEEEEEADSPNDETPRRDQ